LSVHDLKNPLNVICGLPDLLTDGNVLSLIKRAGGQMYNLVSNILDVQKYENTSMKLRPANISLLGVVKEAIYQTDYLFEDKGIVIHNHIDKEQFIFGDHEVLERVFVNLLTNSIKFTPRNGEIFINAELIEDKKCKISVEDTGVGVPNEMLENIFDKFVQAAAKKSGSSRLTGLNFL